MENTNERKPYIEHLNSLLYTRINQQKMLNNTLCEMILKNSDENSITMIKNELDDVMDEINKINEEIEQHFKNNDEVKYTYYGESMDEKAKNEAQKSSGFYDSIIKKNRIAQFKEVEDAKEGKPNIKYNYNNIYKERIESRLSDKLIEELRDSSDSRLQSNRFLVDLKESLGIPEIMVRSVSFDPHNKMVSVCTYDFVREHNGRKQPILQVLKNSPIAFDFTVKHLNASGEVIYTEKYSNCRVTEIYRDPIDYASDDFSKIQLFINYQFVEYEASNQ